MRRGVRKLVAGLLLPLLGCSSLQPVVAPRPYIAEQAPGRIYVVQTDGSRLVLDGPNVQGDSVLGLYAGTMIPATIPMQDLVEIRVRQSNPTGTALLVGGMAVAVGAVAYFISKGSSRSDPHVFYCEPECLGYRVGR